MTAPKRPLSRLRERVGVRVRDQERAFRRAPHPALRATFSREREEKWRRSNCNQRGKLRPDLCRPLREWRRRSGGSDGRGRRCCEDG